MQREKRCSWSRHLPVLPRTVLRVEVTARAKNQFLPQLAVML